MYFGDELAEMTHDELINLLLSYESYVRNGLPWDENNKPMTVEEFSEFVIDGDEEDDDE